MRDQFLQDKTCVSQIITWLFMSNSTTRACKYVKTYRNRPPPVVIDKCAKLLKCAWDYFSMGITV